MASKYISSFHFYFFDWISQDFLPLICLLFFSFTFTPCCLQWFLEPFHIFQTFKILFWILASAFCKYKHLCHGTRKLNFGKSIFDILFVITRDGTSSGLPRNKAKNLINVSQLLIFLSKRNTKINIIAFSFNDSTSNLWCVKF